MRVSCWEIHPVYAIDVCKNDKLSSCKADDDSVYDDAGNVIETHEHKGEFKEP
jgi:hypothetical protein